MSRGSISIFIGDKLNAEHKYGDLYTHLSESLQQHEASRQADRQAGSTFSLATMHQWGNSILRSLKWRK